MSKKTLRAGLFVCLAILFTTLAATFWPVVKSREFWQFAGFTVGLFGSLGFLVALVKR